MGASVVVCSPLRPPRPCHPAKTLNFHESACERSRMVRVAVRVFPPVGCCLWHRSVGWQPRHVHSFSPHQPCILQDLASRLRVALEENASLKAQLQANAVALKQLEAIKNDFERYWP